MEFVLIFSNHTVVKQLAHLGYHLDCSPVSAIHPLTPFYMLQRNNKSYPQVL